MSENNKIFEINLHHVIIDDLRKACASMKFPDYKDAHFEDVLQEACDFFQNRPSWKKSDLLFENMEVQITGLDTPLSDAEYERYMGMIESAIKNERWMPKDAKENYFMNDVVSDMEEFLRNRGSYYREKFSPETKQQYLAEAYDSSAVIARNEVDKEYRKSFPKDCPYLLDSDLGQWFFKSEDTACRFQRELRVELGFHPILNERLEENPAPEHS